jgi:hypothetical protein
MILITPDIVSLATITLACFATYCYRRRIEVAMGLVLLITIAGWVLTVYAVNAAIPVAMKQMEDKAAAEGRPLTLEEGMYDGVGDRVAALFAGWMFGALGAFIGAVLSLPTWIRMWITTKHDRHRGFDVWIKRSADC